MSHFTRTYVIRWSDCDPNGHAANTTYSEYGTDTRVAYLAANGWTFDDFASARCGPVITREEIDYLRELRMGEEVAVDFTILGASADEARFKLAHDLTRLRDGKPCARIVVTGGWMDLSVRRLAPPPERLAAIFRALERGPVWEPLPNAKERATKSWSAPCIHPRIPTSDGSRGTLDIAETQHTPARGGVVLTEHVAAETVADGVFVRNDSCRPSLANPPTSVARSVSTLRLPCRGQPAGTSSSQHTPLNRRDHGRFVILGADSAPQFLRHAATQRVLV
jgi:acyl-CoA thioester hydrolase